MPAADGTFLKQDTLRMIKAKVGFFDPVVSENIFAKDYKNKN